MSRFGDEYDPPHKKKAGTTKQAHQIQQIPPYKLEPLYSPEGLRVLRECGSPTDCRVYERCMRHDRDTTERIFEDAAKLGMSIEAFDEVRSLTERTAARLGIPGNRVLSLGSVDTISYVLPTGTIEQNQDPWDWIDTPYPYNYTYAGPRNYRVPYDVFSWVLSRFEPIVSDLGWFQGDNQPDQDFMAWNQVFNVAWQVRGVKPRHKGQYITGGPAYNTLFNAFVHKRLTHYLLTRFEHQFRLILGLGREGYDLPTIKKDRRDPEKAKLLEAAFSRVKTRNHVLFELMRRELRRLELPYRDLPYGTPLSTAEPTPEPVVKKEPNKMPELTINFADLDEVSRLRGELKNLLEVKEEGYAVHKLEWVKGDFGCTMRYSDTLFDSTDLNKDLVEQMNRAYENWLRIAISNTVQLLQNLGVRFTDDEKREMGL